MPDLAKALSWGIAMILLALGRNYGLVDAKAVDTMFILLPILAFISIRYRRSCLKPRCDEGALQ